MRVLALDTTARRGSFAVAADGRIEASLEVTAPDGFAGAVFEAIDRVLEAAGCALAKIDAFAAASGPGSFTGIRVGLATAKALAEARGKTVVPVSNLEALAYGARGELRAPVLDARRSEVFAALYGPDLREIVPPFVGEWEEFLARVGEQRPTFVSADGRVFEPGGAAPLPEGASRQTIALPAEPLALLALERLQADEGLPPEAVDAAYIRRPDAERNWKG